jgi:hypothetical protein
MSIRTRMGSCLGPRPIHQIDVFCLNNKIYQEALRSSVTDEIFNLVALLEYFTFFVSLEIAYTAMSTRVALEADGPLAIEIFIPFYHLVRGHRSSGGGLGAFQRRPRHFWPSTFQP